MIEVVSECARYLLLIDTCGQEGSLALARLDPVAEIVGCESLPGRAASERLLPVIRELTAAHGGGLKSLRAVAVVHGPGSFTGVRVGLTAAKGLCEALGIPLIAVSRMAVLAEKAGQPNCLALLDAGRGEFYSARYRAGMAQGESLRNAEQVALELSEAGNVAVVCEAELVERLSAYEPVRVPALTAVDALPLALRRLRAEDFDDAALMDGNYVRRTDAEIFAKPARLGEVGG